MKRIAVLIAVALFCAAGAIAETPVRPETVYLPPYPGISGWKKVTNVDNANQVYFEWIPDDQSLPDYKDILVEQAFPNAKQEPPQAFADRLTRGIGSACMKAARNGPKTAIEHGFNVAYSQIYCVHVKKNTQDVDVFSKVIQGRNSLYVLQREFHRPTEDGVPATRAFPKGHEAEAKADMAAHLAAAEYLDAVQVCPSLDGSPCPLPESTKAQGAIPK